MSRKYGDDEYLADIEKIREFLHQKRMENEKESPELAELGRMLDEITERALNHGQLTPSEIEKMEKMDARIKNELMRDLRKKVEQDNQSEYRVITDFPWKPNPTQEPEREM